MRFWTIWTSGYLLREKMNRTGEWFMRGLAHRIPRRLAYWSFIDSGVRYMDTRGDAIVPEVPYCDVLKNFDEAVRV